MSPLCGSEAGFAPRLEQRAECEEKRVRWTEGSRQKPSTWRTLFGERVTRHNSPPHYLKCESQAVADGVCKRQRSAVTDAATACFKSEVQSVCKTPHQYCKCPSMSDTHAANVMQLTCSLPGFPQRDTDSHSFALLCRTSVAWQRIPSADERPQRRY